MSGIERSGYSDLDGLLEVVRRTRELLEAVVDEGELPAGGAEYLAERTLRHVEGVQAGFIGWLRSEAAGLAELQYLLLQTAAARVGEARTPAELRAAAAEAVAERRLSPVGRPRIVNARPWNLAALGHARVVMAFMPRLPEEAVRYPAGWRTYADIPVPRGPAELAERIDELERQIWRTALGEVPATPVDPPFRRTYGFFDAADRLGLRAFRYLS